LFQVRRNNFLVTGANYPHGFREGLTTLEISTGAAISVDVVASMPSTPRAVLGTPRGF
jgi:hypothetical protein